MTEKLTGTTVTGDLEEIGKAAHQASWNTPLEPTYGRGLSVEEENEIHSRNYRAKGRSLLLLLESAGYDVAERAESTPEDDEDYRDGWTRLTSQKMPTWVSDDGKWSIAVWNDRDPILYYLVDRHTDRSCGVFADFEEAVGYVQS